MGHLVTVLGTHPGAGSALVSANLAALLADRGRHQVRLVELDDALGHLADDLGVQPVLPLAGVAELAAGRRGSGSRAEIDTLLTPVAPGLLAVLGPPTRAGAPGSALAPAQRLTGHDTGLLLEALARSCDVVVADAPPSFDDPVVAALAMSDQVVVVTTAEGPAVEALALTLDSLGLMQISADRLVLVLNHVGGGPGPGEGDLLAGTAVPIAVTLPDCPDLPGGAVVSLDQPDLALSRALRRLAERVGRPFAADPAATPATAGAAALALLRRRRGR